MPAPIDDLIATYASVIDLYLPTPAKQRRMDGTRIERAAQRCGVSVPAVVREVYERFGGVPDLFGSVNAMLEPEEWEIEDRRLVLSRDVGSHDERMGIAVDDLDRPDPAVWRVSRGAEPHEWTVAEESTSDFFLERLMYLASAGQELMIVRDVQDLEPRFDRCTRVLGPNAARKRRGCFFDAGCIALWRAGEAKESLEIWYTQVDSLVLLAQRLGAGVAAVVEDRLELGREKWTAPMEPRTKGTSGRRRSRARGSGSKSLRASAPSTEDASESAGRGEACSASSGEGVFRSAPPSRR